MGIAGAVLAPAKSRIAWMLMLTSGIGCFLIAGAAIVFEVFCGWHELFFFLHHIAASFFSF